MAIPSGAGSEIVYRSSINALAGTDTSFTFDRTRSATGNSSYDVPTNFLITVLNVSLCNIDTDPRTFSLKWTDGTHTINLSRNESLPGEATFVWNDRIILVDGDKLIVVANTGNIDCLCNYIVQDWT